MNKQTRFERLVARPKNCATNESITKPALANANVKCRYMPAMEIYFGKRIEYRNLSGVVIWSCQNDAPVITHERIKVPGLLTLDDSHYKTVDPERLVLLRE